MWAISALVLGAVQWGAVRILFLSQGQQTRSEAHEFKGSGSPPAKPGVIYRGPWVLSGGGLALPPGGEGTAAWTVQKRPEGNTTLRVSAPYPPGLEFALAAVSGQQRALVAQNQSLSDSRKIDLGPVALGRPEIQIVVQAKAAKTNSGPVVVVNRLVIANTILTEGNLERISGLAGLIAIPGFLYAALGAMGWERRQRLLGAAAGLLGAALAAGASQAAARHGVWLFGALMIAGAGWAAWKGRLPELSARLWPWAVGAFALCLVDARWRFVAQAADQLDLAPDAKSFIGIIEQARNPFDTAHREPLFPWLIWLARSILGRSDLAVRFLNSLIGAGALALAWVVGRRLGGAAVGLGGMAILGLCPEMIRDGARGLREDLYTAGLLLVIWTLWTERGRGSWRRALGVGAAAGALALTRIPSLAFSLAFMAWFGWRRDWKWPRLAAAAALMLALAFPYLWHIKRLKGEWTYESKRVATYYRNLEFAGQQGYPTKEEIEANSSAGEPVTMMQYIFGEHSLRQVIERTARGLWESLAGYYAVNSIFGGSSFILALGVVGWMGALLLRRWDLIFLPILLAGPTAFLAERVGVFDPRLIAHLAPFLGFLAGMGVDCATRFALTVRGKGSGQGRLFRVGDP